MKNEREFFSPDAMQWRTGPQPGTAERILSRDEADPEVLTRLVRWEPGLDTSLSGVIRHEWVEEVYLLEGDLHDLTLDQTFRAGDFAARPPGMEHGPYRTTGGCVMLEIRYRP
ncbi:cupin domain-containing protein [Streptomyces sp. NPDC059837]|jgi:anti-sigma factor ChrR (cupin superfamily)|uniref:cupin domain-containing protein n=1 Tax=unclassified Streptomyces TaxID=2593676 RepID=UPI0022571A5C|nr:cupin domain-containing protein [Streptomyces sp. NBC_00268]MCX5181597.1 cupin domain-containing protein [Streptomyces sp. NBC_00268]